jgi:carbon monoxide dehydrogenase subunit G
MHQVTITREVPFPVEKVWPVINDFENIYVFHPNVEKSISLNGQSCGLGAERECQFYDGTAVQERVVSHDAANKTYRVEITDPGPFPTNKMTADITVQETTPGKSRVTFDMAFQVKYGPVGWVMGAVMMKPKMDTIISSVLAGLETHIETGRIVGKGGELGASLAAAV